MPTKTSKKELILKYATDQPDKKFGKAEIRKIQAHLRKHLGASGKTSDAYIAQILGEVSGLINFSSPFVTPSLPEPYSSRLVGVLRFNTLSEAEKSLGRLHALYTEYLFAQDRTGTSLIRNLMTTGRQRARSLAESPQVAPRKRREKKEVARWFSIWLDTPDLFFDWLEVRKKSKDFQRRFCG